MWAVGLYLTGKLDQSDLLLRFLVAPHPSGGSASHGTGGGSGTGGGPAGDEDSAAAKAKAFSAKTKERNARLAAAGKRHGGCGMDNGWGVWRCSPLRTAPPSPSPLSPSHPLTSCILFAECHLGEPLA